MSLTEFPQVESLNQLSTFIISAMLGVAFCIFYDIIRAFRSTFMKRSLAVFFADVFFWAVCAVVYFCFALVRCSGMIRIYCLLSCLAGAFVCRLTVSRPLYLLLTGIIKAIYTALRFVKQKVILPVLKKLIKIFSSIAGKIKKRLRGIINFFEKHLPKQASSVYNNKNITTKRRGDKAYRERQKQKNKRRHDHKTDPAACGDSQYY